MHFTVDKEIFLNHLNILQKGLPIKTPLPVLNSIKVEVNEKEMLLTASNSDIAIQTKIEAPFINILNPGISAIPGKYLAEIVRSLNAKEIEIQTDGNQNIIINADRSTFNLKLMDVNDYPNISFLNDNNATIINAKDLNKVISQTAFAASEDEKRPILTGVNVYNKGKILYIVATNGFRLSQRKTQNFFEGEDVSLVIPKKSLDELQKILLAYEQKDIKIVASKTHVLFSFSNVLFQTRLFEGTYPDTEKVIPNDYLITIPFNKIELKDAIKRISIMSNSSSKEKDNYNLIRLILTKERNIELFSSNSELGDAKQILTPAGEIKGNDLDIYFSSRYLTDALNACVSAEVVLSFINSKKAFAISGKDDENLIQVILPVSKQ